MVAIDFQDFNGGSPNGCPSNEDRSFPGEVITPAILPRMIQSRHLACFRIDASNVRPLVVIAVKTRESEILGDRLAAVFFGDHVVDLVSWVSKHLRHLAVFTA